LLLLLCMMNVSMVVVKDFSGFATNRRLTRAVIG